MDGLFAFSPRSSQLFADFSLSFHLPPIAIATQQILGEDATQAVEGAAAHRELMNQRPSVRRAQHEQLGGEGHFDENSWQDERVGGTAP